MNDTRIKDRVLCNPSVKLEKGVTYSFIDMEAITPGVKAVGPVESSEYSGQSCSKFCNGDTLMARITPCLENGKIAQYTGETAKAFGSTEFFVFRGIPKITDNDYVYYLMSTPYIRKSAVNSMTGASGRQRADITFISKIKWDFPSYQEQRRIAQILSAYDKLIEVNNKRIKVLEQIAENLYKEWFVRFRFPGHETIGFIDSKFGKIPDPFSIIRMRDAFDYYIGGGWGNDDPDEDFPIEAYVIRGTDFPRVSIGDVSSCPLRYHKKSNYDARKLKADDLILEVSGGTAEQPVGRTLHVTDSVLSRLDDKVICASFCKLIRVRKSVVSPLYFYYWMQFLYDTRIIDRFQLQSTGIINFQFEYFLRKGEILLPTKTVMDDFDARVRHIHGEIAILAEQNEKLIQQRDLLLPRLMSGQLEV